MSTEGRPVNLTSGSLWSGIWEISWPMLVIMIFNFLVGFTDVYVAGFIGPEVQAAVGFIGQLYFLLIIIANALNIGTMALVSRAIGSGDRKRALEIAKQSLMLSLFIAAVLMFLGHVFYREIIATAGFPAEIREIAELFLRVFAFAIGSNYVLIIANGIFNASGEVKKTLFTMCLVSVFNIAGDFLLVFGIPPFPKLGYMGIAISTACSVTIGMAVNLLFFTSNSWRGIYTSRWALSLETVKRVVTLGWPAGLLQIAWNAGTLVLYNILGRLGDAGITALASITNGLRIEAVIYLPAFALNMAASVLVGQNLGAGNPERAQSVGWKIALAGVGLVSTMALIIFVWAEHFASLLTGDPAVLEETTRYLRINMASEPVMALSAILAGSLHGAGDTKGTMGVIVTAMWLIRLPLAYIFGLVLHYGATGVWVAMVTSMAFQGLLMARRFQRGAWRGLRVD